MTDGRAVTAAGRTGGEVNGFAVPLVLGFMLILALLGGTAMLVTVGDLRVGGVQAAGSRAFAAASSALEHGIATFDETSPTWPVRGRVNGFDYRVDVVRDSFDFGTGRRPVSLDEASPTPAYNGDVRGEPIFVLRARAWQGAFRATQRQWIVRRAVPRIPAALVLSARHVTEWVGGWELSGINASEGGAPVDGSSTATEGYCGENRPALHVAPDAPSPTAGLSLSGNAVYAGSAPPYTRRSAETGWITPEEVLDVPAGRLDAHRRSGFVHSVNPPASLSGVVWITDRAGGPGSCLTRGGCARMEGRGVLIVHNPRYDPRQHDPAHPLYDPVIAADPTFGPARLVDISGGTFRGVLIVDELPATTSGPVRIQGAVVELARRRGATRIEWPAASFVRYSCPAIIDAARAAGSGPRLLAWKG